MNVPIILIGTKTDLRDGRLPEPVVGHAQAGSRGHLTPRQRQEFNAVSYLEGKEAAIRMGAVAYDEACAFNKDEIGHLFDTAAHYGLVFRNPALAAPEHHPNDQLEDVMTAIDRKYQLYSDERCEHLQDYHLEPRRSRDHVLDLPVAAQPIESAAMATSGAW